jgi:hypothetical protein
MGKPIIWSGTNAKLINSGDLVDTNNLSLTDGGKITVTQASHGFTSANVGAPLYYSGTAWVLADATVSANAEVIAYIYAVIDSNTLRLIFNGQIATIGSSVLQGGGSLVAGTTYFLSTTPGQITATPTTVVGQINKPVGTAISTTTLELTNYRGQVVGSTNALTQISLANNATTTVQSVSAYTGGSLSGYVTIVNTTSANSLTFYVNAPFAKYGGASNYYISPSYVGDTPPSGFSMTVTAAGLIQITMPNVSGYSSASIVYGLNVPAVGTNFPLSVNAASILEDGSAFSSFGWNTGSTNVTMSATSPSVQRISSPSGAITVTLPTTGILAGYQMKLVVDSATEANYVKLAASGGAEIDRITGTGFIEVIALVNSPTLSTDWKILNYRNVASLSFSDMTFSSNGGGTWTPQATNFQFNYVQTPGVMNISYFVGPFSISGTVVDLITTLPSRFRTFLSNQTPCMVYNNTVVAFEAGLISSTSGTRAVVIDRAAAANWTVVTNASYFRYSGTLLIN